MNKQLLFCFSVLLLLSGQASYAAADQQMAGKVLMVSGKASVVNDADRALVRRSPVYVGDTLVTGDESQLQLRMTDGALIALGANSLFFIKAYNYDQPDKKDEAVLNVLEGGLRTITGQIEKSNYRLETQAAVLGIRGTAYAVHVAVDGTTTVILQEGSVYVTGTEGSAIILSIPGLATIVAPGAAPGAPGPVPPAIHDYLKNVLPGLEAATWQENPDGSTTYIIETTNPDSPPPSQPPPPGTNDDGTPPAPPPQEPEPEPR